MTIDDIERQTRVEMLFLADQRLANRHGYAAPVENVIAEAERLVAFVRGETRAEPKPERATRSCEEIQAEIEKASDQISAAMSVGAACDELTTIRQALWWARGSDDESPLDRLRRRCDPMPW